MVAVSALIGVLLLQLQLKQNVNFLYLNVHIYGDHVILCLRMTFPAPNTCFDGFDQLLKWEAKKSHTFPDKFKGKEQEFVLNLDRVLVDNSKFVSEFLMVVRRKLSHRASLTIQLDRSDKSCDPEGQSLEQPFSHPKNSCAWLRTVLASLNYRVRYLSSEGKIIASLTSATNCGCACVALRDVDITQPRHQFMSEYLLNATKYEKELELLIETGLEHQSHESCAVVFSSGILSSISPKLGSFIDSHDAVFRFNHAPGGGNYSSVAGKRTTYRFVYIPNPVIAGLEPISPQNIRNIDNSTLLLSVHYHKLAPRIQEYDLRAKGGVGVVPTELRKRGSECVFGAFHENPEEGIKPDGPHLSQGIIGVLAALKTCKRLAIFGRAYGTNRAATKELRSLPYHYYESRPETSQKAFDAVHGKSEEDRFLNDLEDRGILTVIPGKHS